MSDIQKINLNKVEVKLADTDDPVAQKISWEPARGGGASFKTQHMDVKEYVISIRKTTGSIIFSLVFALPGAGAVLVGVPMMLMKGEWGGAAFMFIWGIIFGGAGVAMLMMNKPVIFDKTEGVYYRGKKYDYRVTQDRESQGQLSEIYALQLISERMRSSKGRSYTSYELNLVFKDGDRINIMDHGKGDDVEASAKKLAQFLNVPVWQAVY